MQNNLITIPLGLQEFSVLKNQVKNEEIEIELKPSYEYAICPHCSKVSGKIHPTKHRIVLDTPIQDKKVKLIIRKRRFRCPNCNDV